MRYDCEVRVLLLSGVLALGGRLTSMRYDCEVRVLLFNGIFFYYSALIETPIQFPAFSAEAARFRVKILIGCQGLKC